MSSIVIARGVSYELPNGRELFQNLDFSLGSGLAALVGPNGIGKSCLAKLIAGELEPAGGVMRRNGSIRLFPQRLLPPPVTVAGFLVDYEWSLVGESLLEDIDADALCTTLSGGQWMRVRLAGALSEDFLILDEPTNDLDRDGRQAIIRFLKERRNNVLLISHDRECLQQCTQIFELSNRGLTKFGGRWSAYTQARHSERERLSSALETAKRERDAVSAARAAQRSQQEKRNRRGCESAARGGAPKILLGARKRRAQATTGKIDTTTLQRTDDAVRAAHEALGNLKLEPLMYADLIGREMPAQKLVAEAREFNIRFCDWIYRRDLDFSWRGPVRVALRGANGSGKSTLVKAVLGDASETRGELRRGDLVALHLDQRCSVLEDNMNVFENVRAVTSASDSEIRTGLARFLFAKETVFHPVRTLSGGERLRATLARGFLGTQLPELLVLDEPTNNLDLANVEFLESIVSDFRGALIVISHDEQFLTNCGVTQELVL